MNLKPYLLPVGLMAGTIIGAGVFSLPFVFQAAGLATGYFYLVLAGAVYSAIHLMFADVITATEGEHRFVGYANVYLGRLGFWLAVLMAVVEGIFVLTIYLVLSRSFGDLLAALGTPLEKILIFWFLGSLAIFLSLRRLAFLEFLITSGIVSIIALIFIFGLPNLSNVSAANFYPHWAEFLMPLAAVLFSLAGRVAVYPVVKYCREQNLPIKPAILWGTLMPAVVYGFFVLGIIALSPDVSPDAVSGLVNQVPQWVLWIMGVLGLLSLYSSYIVVGLDIKNTLLFDLKMPSLVSFFIVIGGPILLYLAGFQGFIGLVSFVGGIFLSLEGLFIVAMWLKAKNKKISLVTLGLILVFATALIYEIIK